MRSRYGHPYRYVLLPRPSASAWLDTRLLIDLIMSTKRVNSMNKSAWPDKIVGVPRGYMKYSAAGGVGEGERDGWLGLRQNYNNSSVGSAAIV